MLTDILTDPNYLMENQGLEKRYVPNSWGLKAFAHYVLRYLASVIVDGI